RDAVAAADVGELVVAEGDRRGHGSGSRQRGECSADEAADEGVVHQKPAFSFTSRYCSCIVPMRLEPRSSWPPGSESPWKTMPSALMPQSAANCHFSRPLTLAGSTSWITSARPLPRASTRSVYGSLNVAAGSSLRDSARLPSHRLAPEGPGIV